MSLKNLEGGRETNPKHEILWAKMRFELKPHIFCIFCKFVSRVTDKKTVYIFLKPSASKVKLTDGFMDETGIKL